MNTKNQLHQFAWIGFTVLCTACSTPHRPDTFHSGERQPMKITMGVVSQVSDTEIPLATWKNASQSGRTYGQAAGEAVASLGGVSVPVGIAIALVGSVTGKLIGVASDSMRSTVKGQTIEVQPEQGGEAIQLFQPAQTKKLRLGDRVRIVEGSFVSRLELASE